MKNIDWNKVEEAKDFERVKPGGYICGITAVKDVPEKEYLLIEYDIASGDFKGYYKALYDNKGFWGGSFIRSYSEKSLPFFKSFLTALSTSNPGFVYNNDENTLIGKYIGLVIAEEEYKGNDGKIKPRPYVAQIRSVKAIQANDFYVPELKKLESGTSKSGAFGGEASGLNQIDGKLPWED